MKKIILLILMLGLSINLIASSGEANENTKILNKLNQSADRDTKILNKLNQSVDENTKVLNGLNKLLNEDTIISNKIEVKEKILAISILIILVIILTWKKNKIFKNKIFQNSAKWYGIGYFLVIIVFACLYSICTPNLILSWESYSLMTIPSIFKLFLISLYYSVVTITTLGFGDISPNNSWSMLFTLIESLLGIMFIGLFLNSLSHERSSKEEREKEALMAQEKKRQQIKKEINQIESILRHNKIFDLIIREYYNSVSIISTPMISRANPEFKWNRNFEVSDLCDLFMFSLRTKDGMLKPSIENYFKYQKQMEEQIKTLILHLDLSNWKNLEEECLKLLKDSSQYDFSDFILGQINVRYGDKKAIDKDSESIKNYTGVPNFSKNHKTLNAYIALYFQIQYYLDFIESYLKIIHNIESHLDSLKK